MSDMVKDTYADISERWSYHELQTALDLLEALDASRAESRAERNRPKD